MIGYTQTDIDNLRSAMATGAKRVRIKGEETEFRSLPEMKALLDDMMAEVHPQRRSAFRIVGVSNGY